jgi:hypothetical protein
VIDVDEIQTGIVVADLGLTGPWRRDVDLLPAHGSGTAKFMNSDRIDHGPLLLFVFV